MIALKLKELAELVRSIFSPEELRQSWALYSMSCYYDDEEARRTDWLADEIWDVFVSGLRCVVHGHVLIDDGSWATPDSGGEALRCTRCGWGWSHVYY